MKIVYCTTGLATGGAETMLYHLLSKINRDRFSPVVISLMDRTTFEERIEALDIPVYNLGLKRGKPTAAATWQLIQTIRYIHPDLIQGWMYHGNFAAQVANFFSFRKVPIIWDIQGTVYSLADFESKMTSALIKASAYLSKFAAKIVYVSRISKVQHENLGYEKEKSCVITNACNTSLFIPSNAARLSVRAELGLPANSVLIGLMARYHPMKDHANFIQAAALLLKNYPDTHFLLAGTGVDSKNQSLCQLIQNLGIAEQIHLLGERHDMPRLTAALDIATSASAHSEGWPLVVGEAMSCGVPCAVTDVADASWIVEDTGRVVPPRNAEALARAWQELIVLGAEGREVLGKAARERIVKNFSLDAVVAQYEALYEGTLSKKVVN